MASLMIPYIDSDSTIGIMLCLNKDSHERLRHSLYKHALLRCEHHRLPLKRESIWLHLLETKKLEHVNYLEIKQNVDLNRE